MSTKVPVENELNPSLTDLQEVHALASRTNAPAAVTEWLAKVIDGTEKSQWINEQLRQSLQVVGVVPSLAMVKELRTTLADRGVTLIRNTAGLPDTPAAPKAPTLPPIGPRPLEPFDE